jgi:hypothetical protein
MVQLMQHFDLEIEFRKNFPDNLSVPAETPFIESHQIRMDNRVLSLLDTVAALLRCCSKLSAFFVVVFVRF